jgi:hypothetical protein
MGATSDEAGTWFEKVAVVGGDVRCRARLKLFMADEAEKKFLRSLCSFVAD